MTVPSGAIEAGANAIFPAASLPSGKPAAQDMRTARLVLEAVAGPDADWVLVTRAEIDALRKLIADLAEWIEGASIVMGAEPCSDMERAFLADVNALLDRAAAASPDTEGRPEWATTRP